VQEIERALAIGRAHADVAGRLGGAGHFLDEPQPRPGTARRHLVARALRDGGERLLAADALERGDGGVGVLCLQRHVQDFLFVAQPRQRAQPRRAVLRMPAHRAERFLILQQIDDRRAHVGTGTVARDEHDLLHPAERHQVAHRVNRVGRVVCLRRDASKTADRFGAHVFVGIGPRDVGQYTRLINPCHGGATDARFGVFPRDGVERLGFVWTELVDGRHPYRRVGVLPAGQGAELFENTHRGDNCFFSVCVSTPVYEAFAPARLRKRLRPWVRKRGAQPGLGQERCTTFWIALNGWP
jgi:hypothetical protein